MKITTAWIDDPALHGKIEHPILVVKTTELPDETIPMEAFAGGWSVGKYGPFTCYKGPNGDETAGDYNIRFRTRFPSVVDIVLLAETEKGEFTQFSLPLMRARQLVKKFDPEWRLLISDRDAAEDGTLLWLPTQTNPNCRFWMGKNICGVRPTRPIRVKGVDLAMCESHIRSHNEAFAAKRTAASTSR